MDCDAFLRDLDTLCRHYQIPQLYSPDFYLPVKPDPRAELYEVVTRIYLLGRNRIDVTAVSVNVREMRVGSPIGNTVCAGFCLVVTPKNSSLEEGIGRLFGGKYDFTKIHAPNELLSPLLCRPISYGGKY